MRAWMAIVVCVGSGCEVVIDRPAGGHTLVGVPDTSAALHIEQFYVACSGAASATFTVTTRDVPAFARVWIVGTEEVEDLALDHVGPVGGLALLQRSVVADLEASPNVATAFPCRADLGRLGFPTVGEYRDPPELSYVVRLLDAGNVADCAAFGRDPAGLLASVGDGLQEAPEDVVHASSWCRIDQGF